MDKFTVDLDKVLNDFEYNELTDSSTHANNESNIQRDVSHSSGTNTSTSNYHTSSSFHNDSGVKHSINNVFQSLNEYLNSEINENPKPYQANNVNTIPVRETENASTSDNNYNSRNIENVEEPPRFATNEPQPNCDVIPPSLNNINPELVLQNLPDISNEAPSGLHLQQEVAREEVLVPVSPPSPALVPVPEAIPLQHHLNLPDLQELTIRRQDDSQITPDLLKRVEFDSKSSIRERERDEVPTVNDYVIEREPNYRENIQTLDLISERGVCIEPTRDYQEVVSGLENCNLNLEPDRDSIAENSSVKAGFPADSDRDETEEIGACSVNYFDTTGTSTGTDVTRKLQDDDGDTGTSSVIASNTSVKINKMIDQLTNEISDSNETVISKEKVVVENQNKETEEVRDKRNEDYHNLEKLVNEIEEKSNAENELLDLQEEKEVEQQAPPPLNSAGFNDDLLALNDSELNEYLDQLEKEYESQCRNLEQDIDNDDNKNVDNRVVLNQTSDTISNNSEFQEKNPSVINPTENVINNDVNEQSISNGYGEDFIQETTATAGSDVKNKATSSRPTNLDVTNVYSEDHKEEAKPPIDLIGEPGSTPYNNVYVASALQNPNGQPKETDADSENSSCTSPTFSNASTDTVSSTSASDTSEEPREGPTVPGASQEPSGATEEAAAEEANAQGNVGDRIEQAEISADGSGGGDRDESVVGGAGDGGNEGSGDAGVVGIREESSREGVESWIGKQAPVWTPDAEAANCMHCDTKFTVIKRRHHCRACGLVLCSKCCNLKHHLEYLSTEARVCTRCHDILAGQSTMGAPEGAVAAQAPERAAGQPPNPNNPLEYCSTVPPPLQQGAGAAGVPAVLVPVLKRQGSNKLKTAKSVMFCDGIRPGSDLTRLDTDFTYPASSATGKAAKPSKGASQPARCDKTSGPPLDPVTRSFIPEGGDALPPSVTVQKSDIIYTEHSNGLSLVDILKNEMLTFAIQKNLYVHVKIINMDCCINKTAWCFSTEGLINVGQDEVVILLELIQDEALLPKDILLHINQIYYEAIKGNSVKEMGLSLHAKANFLDSKNHAGFVFIKPTFQCVQNVIKPKEPFILGLLIHRWETPWAKLFPLRLVLRLGADYRYYPSPLISTRHRDSLFVEIGHTIMNLLADFRNFSYTLPQIRGLIIHMEDKNTTVTIPSNRYDQVMKSLSNSSDHILAFAGNFSTQADSHLVCIQDTQSTDNAYSTHAINIHNKPRKVTGASFIVLNGALKSSSGLTAKCSIVEDGLMVQIPPEHMGQLRESLRTMKDHTIRCGQQAAATPDETVTIMWGPADTNFNIGILSPIDDQSMSGVPSIRVHNGKDYMSTSGSRLIRWTEVFIIQNGEDPDAPPRLPSHDPVDISKVSESIARAACQALVRYLDLLVSNSFHKVAVRAYLRPDGVVCYSAGGNRLALPPIYMRSLDNELVPVLHRISTGMEGGGGVVVLELVFRILNV